MSVQKLIFPGFVLGVLSLVFFTRLIGVTPGGMISETTPAQEMAVSMAVQPVAESHNNPSCTISSQYPDSIQQWCGLIERYAGETGLDPNLVSAVMLQESAGQPDAYSKSGAVGLLQVMPRDGKAARFMCKNGPCFADRPSMNELFDPEYNVAYGANMLAGLIRQHGDVREALKAYGPMDVGYYYADLVLGILASHQ